MCLQAHRDAEPVFAQTITERTGQPVDDLRTGVQAAVINAALSTAVEHHAWNPTSSGAGLDDAVREALRIATGGVPG